MNKLAAKCQKYVSDYVVSTSGTKYAKISIKITDIVVLYPIIYTYLSQYSIVASEWYTNEVVFFIANLYFWH